MKPFLFLSFTVIFAAALPVPVEGAEPSRVIQDGDHVAIVGNTFADLMHIHGYFETLLRHRCADCGILVRNFGWAGDTLSDRARPENFASEDKWLSDYQADVIFVCFGMGESFAGMAGLPAFNDNLRRLLDHYQQQQFNGKSKPSLILVSPIACEDVGAKAVNVAERNADLQQYTGSMREIARDMNIVFVDLFQPTKRLMEEGDGSRLTSNGIHLTPYGYWAVSQILVDKVAPTGKPLRLAVNASSLKQESDKTFVSPIDKQGNAWSWNVEADSWPTLAPPQNSRIHSSLLRFCDQLVVKSLPPGRYKLTIGSDPPIIATAQQWADGVTVTSSPRHESMESYRHAVNEKNLMHFHGWRALNQVHIVGERKKSPSGRALPAELAEWMRQADEADERLASVPTPSKNEMWVLEEQ